MEWREKEENGNRLGKKNRFETEHAPLEGDYIRAWLLFDEGGRLVLLCNMILRELRNLLEHLFQRGLRDIEPYIQRVAGHGSL